jgi:hypothetical protein
MIGHNNSESVSLISEVNKSTKSSSPAVLKTSQTERRKYEYVDLDDYEAWRKFFSTRVIHEREPTSGKYIYHDKETGKNIYRYTAQDENKFNGRYIKGRVADKIAEEISKKNDAIKVIAIKESRNDDKIVEPALRIELIDNKKEVNMSDLLNSDVCTKYAIKAITICKQGKTRGMRARVDKNGARIYEVANGSYEMTLKWHNQGKECNMKININASDSVSLISHNGVTIEDLRANNVKVGVQLEAKYLHEHEALVSQLHKSSETVRLLEPPSTNMTDTSTTHQACAACHK